MSVRCSRSAANPWDLSQAAASILYPPFDPVLRATDNMRVSSLASPACTVQPHTRSRCSWA